MEWNEKRERTKEENWECKRAKEEEKIVDLMNENTHTQTITRIERERTGGRH